MICIKLEFFSRPMNNYKKRKFFEGLSLYLKEPMRLSIRIFKYRDLENDSKR